MGVLANSLKQLYNDIAPEHVRLEQLLQSLEGNFIQKERELVGQRLDRIGKEIDGLKRLMESRQVGD